MIRAPNEGDEMIKHRIKYRIEAVAALQFALLMMRLGVRLK